MAGEARRVQTSPACHYVWEPRGGREAEGLWGEGGRQADGEPRLRGGRSLSWLSLSRGVCVLSGRGRLVAATSAPGSEA